MKNINIVSYGGGVNSTALLVECLNQSIEVNLILFADTGGEKPHTYQYVKLFNAWLVAHNMPEIITVRAGKTLEQRCLDDHCLPSIAYGHPGCADRHKIQPQNKYCNNYEPAKEVWKRGEKVVTFIGIDADEAHRAKILEDKKYIYRYLLVEWDFGRDECEDIIQKAGLPLPGKSACFFCPSTKRKEIRALKANYSDLAERALVMERNAINTSVKGLGRNFSWENVLSHEELFDFPKPPEITCGCYD